MQASNVSRDVLESAARSVGVRVDLSPLNRAGTRFRVKLTPDVPADADAYTPKGRRRRGERGNARYQREAAGYFTAGRRRRVHAVCWHGFRDYFRAVFALAPEAVFRTALATYRGADHFEATYRDTGSRNVGCEAAPVWIATACACGEGAR